LDLSPKYIRDDITKMGSLVESILHKCLDEKISLDEILTIEEQIDDFHMQIDDRVFKYIALKKPAAKDLREALSIMKINTDLERMADQAVVIKRYWDECETRHKEINLMNNEVCLMVKNCLDCFVEHNQPLARQTIEDDQQINQMNRDLAKKFIDMMKHDKLDFDEGFALVRVVKNLERIADLATNIAEDVVFLESGADIRHRASKTRGKIL